MGGKGDPEGVIHPKLLRFWFLNQSSNTKERRKDHLWKDKSILRQWQWIGKNWNVCKEIWFFFLCFRSKCKHWVRRVKAANSGFLKKEKVARLLLRLLSFEKSMTSSHHHPILDLKEGQSKAVWGSVIFSSQIFSRICCFYFGKRQQKISLILGNSVSTTTTFFIHIHKTRPQRRPSTHKKRRRRRHWKWRYFFKLRTKCLKEMQKGPR